MQRPHFPHERLFRRTHVEQRLTETGFLEEHDEVHRMPRAQRHADLRIVLEAADAGAVPRADR